MRVFVHRYRGVKPPASSGLNDCACPVRQWHAPPVSSFAAKGYVSSMKQQGVATSEALGSSAGTRGRSLVERCLLACSISDLRFGSLAGRGLRA